MILEKQYGQGRAPLQYRTDSKRRRTITLTKRTEKGLLTPDNCVVTMIDLQPQMLFGVGNFDRQSIINNNLVLSKAARVSASPWS